MKKLMNWLKNEESGQGMVEYGLILALIAIVVIVALRALGTKVNAVFENVNSKLS
jgi:pilus assembly protein Flp/PilA